MQDVFHGIVLFNKPYKEMDAMIKVFTLEYGKQMFFVKNLNSGTHPLRAVLAAGSRATFIGQINPNGLSFLSDYKDKKTLWQVMDDIKVQAYLAYFLAMADALVDDRIVNEKLYQLLVDCLDLIQKGLDIEVLSFLFEVKALALWQVPFDFSQCVLSHQKGVPLDISFKYSGCISQPYFERDPYRLHLDPNTVYLLDRFQRANLKKLGQIKLSSHFKKEMRRALDALYGEYVGIRLKSKAYIDTLDSWLEEGVT